MRLDVALVLRSTAASVLRLDGDGLHPGELSVVDLARAFRGVTVDSRSTSSDDLFVAIHGERVDGHDFAGEALASGALGCLVARVPERLPDNLAAGDTRYLFLVPDTVKGLGDLARGWRRGHDVEVIGVTGSIGKTTAKEIIAAVLGSAWPVLRNEANFNTEIGLPLTLLNLRREQRAAVLEMGMYLPGDIAYLARVAEPRIGVVTNVAPIHLARVGSLARIARAKSELVAALPVDGLAVLNGDDPWTRAMAVSSGIAPTSLVGRAPDCDVRALEVTAHGLEGLSITVRAEGREIRLRTHVPGEHTVHAFLAAIAVARFLGLDWETIAAVAEATRVDVRQRMLRGPDGMLIIDDSYNAAPLSVAAALELLKVAPGRKIAVLGDMLELGAEEEEAHRQVGGRAAEVADWLVVRGPRSAWIAEEAERLGFPAARVRRAGTNQETVEVVRSIVAEPGDTDTNQWAVLVKGSRGMRMEEVVSGLRGES